jgi:hypothetical protein
VVDLYGEELRRWEGGAPERGEQRGVPKREAGSGGRERSTGYREEGGERWQERERESCVAAKRGRWVRMTETLESQYI